MNKIYACGIDVGIKGCFSIVSKQGNRTKYEEHSLMPSLKVNKKSVVDQEAVRNLLIGYKQKYPYLTAVIEKQGVIGNKGTMTTGFTTGRRMGFLEGVCIGLCIPVIVVAPQTWQKLHNRNVKIPAYLNRTKLKDTKKRSLTWCKAKYPDVNLKTSKGRHLDELSDSILIAYWGLTKGINK